MDEQTAERMARMEKRMNVLDKRLADVEHTLEKLSRVLRKQGLKPGKNYDAP